MTTTLALVSAVLVGGADFLVSLAARRARPESVPVFANAASLLAIVAALSFVDAPNVRSLDLAWGAPAGGLGAIGFLLFLTAMSRGQMSIIAPITATVGAMTTVVAGVARGERPDSLTWVGIVLAALAITLISSSGADAPVSLRPHDTSTISVIVLAVSAGIGFGAFFSALAMTEDGAGLWPLVPARLVSLPLSILVARARGASLRLEGRTRLTALGGGVVEGVASVLLLEAVRRGPLAVAGVLGSLYPVSTVFLAWVVVGERLQRIQWIGVTVALLSIPLISA